MHADGLLQGGGRCAVHVLLTHCLEGKGQAHGLVGWLAQLVMAHHHAFIPLLSELDFSLSIAGTCLQYQAPV